MSASIWQKVHSIKINSEKGFYIPLAAVITFFVLATLIGLGYDSAQLHRSSARLGQRAEEVCQYVARHPGLQSEVAGLFKQEIEAVVNNNLVKGVTLTSAQIIVPTMQAGGCFGFYEDAVNNPCSTDITMVNGQPTSFASLGVNACNLNCANAPGCQSDCYFQGEVDDTTSFVAGSTYVPTMWNDLQHAGTTVACEISGVVNTIFHGPQTIKAKTTWRKDIRGDFPNESDPTLTREEKDPGVTLIIAPHQTTRANDSRYRFTDLYNDPAWTSLRTQTDALKKFNQTQTTSLFGADFQPTSMPPAIQYPATMQPVPAGGNPPYAIQPPRAISPHCNSETTSTNDPIPLCNGSTNVRNGPGPGQPYLNTASYNLSDLEEMFVHCMNPFILARNLLTSGIVEHLARHGQARNMTQILLAGTQNWTYQFPNNQDFLPYITNPPTLLVDFGEDLLAANYQLPFIASDLNTNESPPVAPDLAATFDKRHGWINPFNLTQANPTADVSWQDHHTLLANQLRYCYSMFGGQTTAIERVGNEGLHIAPGTLVNAVFEPTATYDYIPQLRTQPFPNLGSEWDQKHPWGSTLSPSPTRNLSAPELLSAVGAVESCPYEQSRVVGLQDGAVSNDTCYKPAIQPEGDASYDLRPDLLGALCYARGDIPWTNTSIADPCPQLNFPAMDRPGIFPLDPAYEATSNQLNVQFPYTPNAYTAAVKNKDSAIVIVTHRRLSNAEETAIHDLLQPGGPFDHRPITVIWMPTYCDEWDGASSSHPIDEAIKEFESAFNIDRSIADTSETSNALFVLSPCIAKYNLEHPDTLVNMADPTTVKPFSTFPPAQQSERFEEYLYYLLTDPDEGVHIVAKNIVWERIMKMRLYF